MEVIKYAIGLQIIATAIIIGILVVLVFKRFKSKRKEDFEKRDN